jgi:hypothetical protein
MSKRYEIEGNPREGIQNVTPQTFGKRNGKLDYCQNAQK